MSSKPQPRSSSSKKPQGDSSSCGHIKSIKDCPECQKTARNNVIDLPTEKKKIAILSEKIKEKFQKDPKAALKAAVILTGWLNNLKKPKAK